MKHPTLYILCGLPYAGKTTLTRELLRRFDFSIVSMDDIMDAKHLQPDSMTQEDWNNVYTDGYNQLQTLLSSGKSVVLDLGNLKRSERDTARGIATKIGVPYKLIYIATSVDEVLHRRLKNMVNRERGHLTDAAMNQALSLFEQPTPDENPILYHPDSNLDIWINKYIR